ncbi:hypothetical protein BJX61DRAFT_514862 [Aspergillus egyptiacus]|nr:hypothetical protein BJX61DRAFT_514862 [Aspergillus egyptiacus]
MALQIIQLTAHGRAILTYHALSLSPSITVVVNRDRKIALSHGPSISSHARDQKPDRMTAESCTPCLASYSRLLSSL